MSLTAFPRVFRLRQRFDATCLADPAAEVRAQLARLGLEAEVRPGQSVAIAAGSRGIARLPEILRATADHFRALGAAPLVVPAMGSHGGGTAEGQRRVLHDLGVTESAVGCPIRSSMETVVIAHAREGFPIHFDRLAFEADHVVVCNRVKPHTRFAGTIESGLMKMLLIGLGKCAGATVYHRAIHDHGFDRVLRGAAAEVLSHARVLCGVAIIENAFAQPARIAALRAEAFASREPELLALARRWMARLPFDVVDVLLVDRIGKDVSGVGMDANVVGRKFDDHKAVEGETPRIKNICVRGLTPASGGNAIGIGLAEFCHARALGAMDVRATRLNALVSGHVSAAMLPLDYPTDREMLAVALGAAGLAEPAASRLMWIADTLRLETLAASEAYLAEARSRDDLEVLGPPTELPFDLEGNLPETVLDWRPGAERT